MAIKILNSRTLQYAIKYPGEEQYNAREKLKVSGDGTRIDGFSLTAQTTQPDGTLILTTQGTGRDDNRTADIQFVYYISRNDFRIRKNVRFDEDEAFFNRNEYSFSR